jgi:hypothetical protein
VLSNKNAFAMFCSSNNMQHQAEMVLKHCSIGADTVNADVIGTDDKCAKFKADALPTQGEHEHLCMQHQPKQQNDRNIGTLSSANDAHLAAWC